MSERYHFIPRTEIGPEAWDGFVTTSPEAWFMHLFYLIEALSSWKGRKDYSFALADGDRDNIVAIVPLYLIEHRALGFLSYNSLEDFGGVATRIDLGHRQRFKVKETIIENLKKIGRDNKCYQLKSSILPATPAYSLSASTIVNPLLELGYENKLTQSWVLSLQNQNLQSLVRGYSQYTRQEIRKAESQQTIVRLAKGPEDLEFYYNLHQETCSRTKIQPHPFDYFRIIFQNMIKNRLVHVLFALDRDKVVAAQSSIFFKGRAFYWMGASADLRLGGENRYLTHLQIQYAVEQGIEWYDMGEAFPNEKGTKNRGLSDYKRSFGGHLHPYYKGEINLKSKSGLLTQKIKKALDIWGP